MRNKIHFNTLRKKLVFFTTGLLIVSSLAIGLSSYYVARNALIERGKITLKNGVNSALILIAEMNKEVEKGSITLEEAQEQVKVQLIGPLLEDGTRQITNQIDFGENGYYIAYSLEGIELMHPNLEGQNVWFFEDKNEKTRPFYLVQDKIEKALTGGGFTEYTWEYPFSSKLGKKIVYSKYEPSWGWVVTAGSYISDFDAEAFIIIEITAVIIFFVVILGFLFSRKYIHLITKPLSKVVNAMSNAELGDYHTIELKSSNDEMGHLVAGFNNMIESITKSQSELISKDDQLLQFAYYDSLSGLPNAYFFKISVSSKLASPNGKRALLLIDIKDFNFINSIYGSEYGDQIIKFIGNSMISNTESDLIVARVGGNEFAVWMDNVSVSSIEIGIYAYIEKLKMLLKQNNFINHLDFYMGLVILDGSEIDFDQAYKKASIALQYSKTKGHIHINQYNDEMHQILERESKIIELSEIAIKQNDFTVNYQSKVNAITGEVVGVESLARWFTEELGNISPAEFIPLLYKANLMTQFTKLIIDTSFQDFHKLKEKYNDKISLSINIPPNLLFEVDFIDYIKTSIEKYKIDPQKIMLEITEDVFISDFDLIKIQIEGIKNMGIKISLDDFGTGYSSLNYLTKVKFDEIKVDKTFVDHIITDPTSEALFKSIVKIANALECDVVAEGVESQEQVLKAIECGCLIIQGYVYSKPEPLII